MTIQGLRRVVRGVGDLPRAREFYSAVLGFQGVTSSAEAAVLRLGAQEIELVAGQTAGPSGTAADLWFQHIAIVVSDMAAAVELVLGGAWHGDQPGRAANAACGCRGRDGVQIPRSGGQSAGAFGVSGGARCRNIGSARVQVTIIPPSASPMRHAASRFTRRWG